MQFVLVIYHGDYPPPGTPGWDALAKEDRDAAYVDYAALNALDNVHGMPPFGLPENATTVRVADGATITADGPYVGIKGAVGGVMVVEADDLDAAVAIAARVPQARLGGAVEVRPSAKYW
ncbi:YciI family protein [Actinophytocola sediminis]